MQKQDERAPIPYNLYITFFNDFVVVKMVTFVASARFKYCRPEKGLVTDGHNSNVDIICHFSEQTSRVSSDESLIIICRRVKLHNTRIAVSCVTAFRADKMLYRYLEQRQCSRTIVNCHCYYISVDFNEVVLTFTMLVHL